MSNTSLLVFPAHARDCVSERCKINAKNVTVAAKIDLHTHQREVY